MAESSISDHIGRIGENYFDTLANKAKLLVGQILPDRLGRDRVLEFELEPMGLQPYDKRPPPIGCSVQIKSILSTNDRVSLSLSVAERLAGDTRPAFICIFRVDQDDEIKDMHLIHILGKNLERILKRLRKEYSKGTENLNKKSISFQISSGSLIDLNATSLKAGFKNMIDVDMETYSRQKIHQRKTAGFDRDGFLTGNVAFDVESPEELIDGMLGLKKLKLRNFEIFEERFKIKLPFDAHYPHVFKGSVFEVIPEPVDTAILCFKNLDTGDSAKLDCEIIAPGLPNIPFEHLKFIARTKLFDAIISKGKFSINNSTLITEDIKLSASTWIEVLRCWQIMSSPSFEIGLTSNMGKSLFQGSAVQPAADNMEFPAELDVLEKFQQLRTEAKADDDPIDLQSILDASQDIRLVHAYFFEPSKVGKLSFQFVGVIPLSEDQLPIVFITALIVGEERYAYGLHFEMDVQSVGEEHSFTSYSMRAFQISQLKSPVKSLHNFGNQLCKISGVQMRVVQDIVSIPDTNTLDDQT